MADRNLALSLLITAKDLATSAINKVRAALGGAADETERVATSNTETQNSNEQLGDSFDGLTGKITALIGTYVTLNGLKDALLAILETGGLFEKLGNQMTAAFKSVSEGRQATSWIAEFARTTPFGLEGVTTAFQTLKNFGLDPMDGSLQAIADQTSKLGAEQQTLERISLALGQAWAKQKLQGEEILQLIDAGVPVWELLANATGRNAEELGNLATKGELGRDVIRSLITEIGRSSEGASQAMMSSWVGLVSNLNDTWQQFLNTIAESGTLDYFKNQIEGLLASVERMAKSGELQKIAEDISDFFVGTAETIKSAGGLIVSLADDIKTVALLVAGTKLGNVFSPLIASASAAASGVSVLALSLLGLAKLAKASLYGVLIDQVFKVAAAYQEWQSVVAQTEIDQKDLDDSLKRRGDMFADLSKQVGLSIASMRELDKAVADGLVVFDKQEGVWRSTVTAMRDFDDEVNQLAKSQNQLVGTFGLTVDEMTKIGKASDDALAAFQEWGKGATVPIEGIAAGLKKLTDGELKAMQTALSEAFESGINKSDELAASLSAISAEEVTRAWALLGGASEKSLNQAADAAKRAYITIRDSGTASSGDLVKSWNLYTNKIKDAAAAINQVDEAERQRAANLATLEDDRTGDDRYERQLELERKNAEFKQKLRDEDFAGAVKAAQEAEKLAFAVAEAEKKAFESGDALNFDKSRAIDNYKIAIQNTTQALDELAKKQLEAAPADQEQTDQVDPQQAKLDALISKKTELAEPVNIVVKENFDEINSKADQLIVKLAQINAGISQAQTIPANSGDVVEQINREALARGRR